MIYERNGNLHLYQFDSFEAYLDRAANPLHRQKYKVKPGDVWSSGYGTEKHRTAIQNARLGWSESFDEITDWANLVVQDISSQLPKPEIQFDKIGSFWDLGRVIENDPDCWIHEEPSMDIDRAGRGNIVRMVINTASSDAVRSESHINRCGAILALCTLLEQVGYYIQFEVTTAIEVGWSKVEFRTVAKRASEALNLGCVSYWCSREMEYIIDFSICETIDQCTSRTTFGALRVDYGAPIFTHDPGDICFDRMTNVDGVNWADKKSVRRYIIKQLKKQGIQIKD